MLWESWDRRGAAGLGVDDQIELQMGTLSKAFGLSGGYLAASRLVIDLLINRARNFIYTTAPPPALAYAAHAALAILKGPEGDELRHCVMKNVQTLAAIMTGLGIATPSCQGAILPAILGCEERALHASRWLSDRGFLIPCIRYPTVARKSARLRITVSASHGRDQIESLGHALRQGMP
jgi:7-keto-8-aminopelargonate synthetase-like enzyme